MHVHYNNQLREEPLTTESRELITSDFTEPPASLPTPRILWTQRYRWIVRPSIRSISHPIIVSSVSDSWTAISWETRPTGTRSGRRRRGERLARFRSRALALLLPRGAAVIKGRERRLLTRSADKSGRFDRINDVTPTCRERARERSSGHGIGTSETGRGECDEDKEGEGLERDERRKKERKKRVDVHMCVRAQTRPPTC